MNSSLMAVRTRGRIPCYWLVPVLFLLVALHSESAFSASLAVGIRQINPAGDVQRVTCENRQKCLLPIDIQTGATKETLTVGISFVSGNLVIHFQAPKGFLYAGDKVQADAQHPLYQAIWSMVVPKAKPTKTQITLFEPLVPFPNTALPLDKPGKAVADLEITAEATP